MLAGRPCGRWVPLMGGTPATHRRSRCASLATLPKVAFRPPPLTPAPPAERLRSMASRGRHRSAVRRTGPLAPGRRAPSCDAPHGSRLLGVGSTGAHLPGLALPWATGSLRAGKIWIPLHGIILPPAAGANRSEVALAKRGRDACCVPAQVLSPRARSGSRAPCAQVPRTPSSPSLSRAA